MEEVSVCLFPHAPPDTHTHVLLCPGRLLKVGGVSCSFFHHLLCSVPTAKGHVFAGLRGSASVA